MVIAKSIMIVDDNPDDIEITRIALNEIGRQEKVEAALNGEEALRYLRNSEDLPGLILLDLKMPGMNGFDCLREIRADQKLQNIPVVVVTSSSLEADICDAFAAGANNFLYKEIDLDRFSASLNGVLQIFLNNS